MFWTSTAYAMGTAAQQNAGQEAPAWVSFAPMLILLFIFYFLLIRPQQKKAKEHRDSLSKLKVGDVVITNGGICGTIIKIKDDLLQLDLGDSKVFIPRGYISGTATPDLTKLIKGISQPAPKKTKSNKKSNSEAEISEELSSNEDAISEENLDKNKE